MADLLMADAWATCTRGVAAYPEKNDAYVKYLGGLIKNTANTCTVGASLCTSESTCNVGERWRSVRETKSCNGYQGTGQTAALTFYSHDRLLYDLHADASDFPLSTAQTELNVAEVNLCVAQKLREDMVSAPGLLMTAADHLEALAHVRERAQLSMLQYTAIAGVVQANPPGHPRNEGDFGPALGTWAAKPSSKDALLTMGADAAAAMTLHVDASRELGGLLRQYVSSQLTADTGDGWGNGSWRARLAHLMFGGDPLGDYGAGKRWQTYAGAAHSESPTFFGRVTEDEESPQIQTLLGLARKVDGLYFYANPSTFAPDPVVSAARLFQVVETSLRVPSCLVPAAPECADTGQGDNAVNPPPPPPYCQSPRPTCQRIVPSQQNLPTLGSPQGSLLMSKYGITPEHVLSLARTLTQAMPRVSAGDPTVDVAGVFDVDGAHELVSANDVSSVLPGAPFGSWYRLDPGFNVMPRSQHRLSDVLSGLVDYHSTYQSHVDYEPSRAFLGSTPKGNAAMRELGAVPALTLARDVIAEGSRAAAGGGRPTLPFFQKAMTAMPFVEAAIGSRSVSVRPITDVAITYPKGWEGFPDFDRFVEHQLPLPKFGSLPRWSVAVITKKTDPFRRLVAAPGKTFIDMSALDATFRSFGGKTRETYFGPDSAVSVSLPSRVDDLGYDGLERRVYEVTADQRSLFLSDDSSGTDLTRTMVPITALPDGARIEEHTFIVQQPPDQASSSPSVPVGEEWFEVKIPLRLLESGRYMSYGGEFGKMVEDAWAVKSYNWSKAAFDGLGVKTDWFPPTTDLPDIAPGQTAASYFLSLAGDTAMQARTRSTELVKNLIDVQHQEAQAEEARKAALQAEIDERQTMCGGSPTTPNACDTTVVDLDLIGSGVVGSGIFCSQPFCEWYGRLRDRAFPKTLPVLKAVRDAVNEDLLAGPDAPTFDQYEGGTLQDVLSKQWVALRRLHESAKELQSFLIAGANEAKKAQDKLTVVGQMVAYECSEEAFRIAHESGFSFGGSASGYGGTNCQLSDYHDGVACYVDLHDNLSFSPGPFYAQLRACEKQKLSFQGEQLEAAGILNGLYTKMYGYVVQAHQVGDDVRRATNDARRLAQQARLAVAKAKFESDRVGAELVTRFGTYRRFYMHDAGAARAQIELARILALYARRSVEADYVVDLSRIYATGPLLPQAPASWADKVYEPSLDLVALMNLDLVEGGATPDGGPDWFSQYVQDLDNFRVHYVISHHNMTVSGINQLVELPPPEKLVATPVSGGGTVNVVSDEVAAWSFYCPATQAWKVHPKIGEPLTTSSLPTLCDGSRPTKAKLTFALDPWGRLNGDPYEQGDSPELRYNMRALQFAVNLEGEGITTCTTAGCTRPLYVDYNLSQFSPAWLSDVDQDLHAFDVNVGRALHASALAMRKKVILIGSDFDSGELAPFLNNENVKRLELVSRPLGAAYELEFNLANGVRIENVSNVQLLFKHSYWQ